MCRNPLYYCLLLFFLLLSNQSIEAQITFQKSYGYLYNDQPNDVAVSKNNAYVLCGCTTTLGITPTDGYILKVDSLGQKLWSVVVGEPLTDCMNSVVVLDDGSVVALGNTSTITNSVAFLVKIDPTGNLVWSKTYEEDRVTGDKIVKTEDNGFLIAGGNAQMNTASTDLYLAKLDSNGNILWGNTYQQAKSQLLEDLIINDRGYFAVGSSYFNGVTNSFITQFDQNGNVIWGKEVSGVGLDYIRNVINLPTGNLLLIGGEWTQSGNVVSLIEIDTSAAVQVAKGYSTDFHVQDATVLSDGSYALIGSSFTPSAGMQGQIMKLDQARNSLWTKIYGGLSGERFMAIAPTVDSGMVSIGWTMSYGFGGDDYWIVKTDKNGEFETCSPETDTLSVATFTINPTIASSPIIRNSALVTHAFVPTIPTFLDSVYTICVYPQPPIANFMLTDSVICEGDCINLLDSSIYPATWFWTFDGAIPTFDTLTNPTNICFPTVGTYAVTLKVSNEFGVDSITKHITVLSKTVLNLGNDTTICANENLTLESNITGDTYLWSDGTMDKTTMVTAAGTYWLEVTNGNCVMRDSIQIDFYPIPSIDLGNDTVICGVDTILLDAAFPNVTYLWQDNSTFSTFPVTQTGNYSVKIMDDNNCITTDSITITYLSNDQLDLGNDTILCEGNQLELSVFQPNLGYLWQNGSNTSNLTITQSGLYWVELFALTHPNQCVIRDSIQVEVTPTPPLDLGSDTTLCEGHYMNLQAPKGYTYEWQDGSTNDFFWVTSAGNYWVIAQDSGICVATDSVYIDFTQPLSPTLPLDTVICENQTTLLNAYHPDAISYQWTGTSAYYGQNDENAPTFTATFEGLYQVDMTNACGTLSQFTVLKKENCNCNPFIPNAFTPNNDGQNDVFSIYPTCDMTQFSVQVFDRWGNLIFQSTDLDFEWDGRHDGKMVADGVYVWVVKYNGVGEDGKLKNWQLVGDLSILR